MLMKATATLAVEWSAEPSLALKQEWNDNIRLATANHDSVWGTTLQPELALRAAMEDWVLGATARLSSTRYSDNDEAKDRDNQYLDLNYLGRTEIWTWSVDGRYRKSTTLVTDDVLDPDTGLFIDERTRKSHSVSPEVSYRLNETTSLALSGDWEKVSYSGQRDINDFRRSGADLTVSHQLTEKYRVFGVLGYSQIRYDDSDFESDTYTLVGGLEREFSSTLSGTITAGVRRSRFRDTELVPEDPTNPIGCVVLPDGSTFNCASASATDNSSGGVLSARLQKKFELTRVDLDLSRSIEPDANGAVVEADNVGLKITHRLSERMTGRLSADLLRTRTEGGINTTSSSDRDILRISPGVSYQLARDWDLTASYRYARRERSRTNQSAESNAVQLNLSYHWPRISISR